MVCPRNGGGRLREKARFTRLFTFCAEQKSREEPEKLNAIRGGDKDALAGGKTEHEQLEEKVETGRSKKHASMDEADSASKKAAASAKAEFRKALAEATADEDVSDDEEKRIRKAQDAYSLAEGLVDKYEAKLRNAQDATAKQTSMAKPQGTFFANAAQSLRGSQMEQRMLTATQEIVKHTKKTVELLKDGAGGGGTMTFQ